MTQPLEPPAYLLHLLEDAPQAATERLNSVVADATYLGRTAHPDLAQLAVLTCWLAYQTKLGLDFEKHHDAATTWLAELTQAAVVMVGDQLAEQLHHDDPPPRT